jgi:hypothetical protein
MSVGIARRAVATQSLTVLGGGVMADRADLLQLATLTLVTMKLRGETMLGVWPLDGSTKGMLASPQRLAKYWGTHATEMPDSYNLACALVGWTPPTLDTPDAER